jgi:hypothetical protein
LGISELVETLLNVWEWQRLVLGWTQLAEAWESILHQTFSVTVGGYVWMGEQRMLMEEIAVEQQVANAAAGETGDAEAPVLLRPV